MDNSSFSGNRQFLLIGAAVTGLTLVIAYSIQPMLPLADANRQPPASTDTPLDDVFAAELEEPERLAAAKSRSLASVTAAPANEGTLDLPRPQRYVRRSRQTTDAPAPDIEAVDSEIPAAYRDRLALLDREREVAMRRRHREETSNSQTSFEPSAARAALVSVEESQESAPASVMSAAAETEDVRNYQRVNRVRHHPLRTVSVEQQPRGAWLAGTIESD